MALLYRDLGIDLGTVNTLIAEGGEIVLSEPTMAAIDVDDQKIVALGQEAKDMYGRVPEGIEVMFPLRDGVIADYEVTERILSYFIQKVCGPVRLFKPRAMVTVPYGVTSVEGRAAHEAAFRAGCREVFLVPRSLAAAVGSGLPIGTPSGNMVVYLGGGVSESSVIAVNGIVVANTVRLGGQRLDEALASYVRHKYGLVVGDTTSEEIKLKVGAAIPLEQDSTLEVQGRDQVNGLPRKLTVTTSDVLEALEESLLRIGAGVRATLEKTPPELTSDIIDRGMMLCGGGALLRGMDRYLTQITGVPAYLAEEPVACLALGAERVLHQVELFRRFLPPA
ncbi:MAG: rod shape-determining protein [Anaerolineales bacterium]|jgi:rod shape-determining protein MreB